MPRIPPFTRMDGFWYAAVEPGYNARRRARYAIRRELVQRGLLEASSSSKLHVQPANLGSDVFPGYEIWCTTRPYPDPARDGMMEK